MALSTALRPDMSRIFSFQLTDGSGECGPFNNKTFGYETLRVHSDTAGVKMLFGASSADASNGLPLEAGREYFDISNGEHAVFSGPATAVVTVVPMERVD